MLYAFEMTLEIAQEFYKRVEEQKANTEEERVEILAKMTEEGLIKHVTVTERSKEKYVEDLRKNFSVLEVKKEKKSEN